MALTVLRAMQGKGAVVVDIDAGKRKAAMEAGALAAIDGAASDAIQQIIKATGGGASACSISSAHPPPSVWASPASRRVVRSSWSASMAAS